MNLCVVGNAYAICMQSGFYYEMEITERFVFFENNLVNLRSLNGRENVVFIVAGKRFGIYFPLC